MSRKTGDLSAHGHYEEVVLADLDMAFDVETIADAHRVMGEEIARRRALEDRSDRAMAAAWHQMGHALRELEESLAVRHRHAVEARRLADERLERLGVAA